MGGFRAPYKLAMPWDDRDDRKKKERIAAGDAATAERHRMFDLQAQDNTPKSDRPHFAVVTHGSEQFRENFAKIDWEN